MRSKIEMLLCWFAYLVLRAAMLVVVLAVMWFAASLLLSGGEGPLWLRAGGYTAWAMIIALFLLAPADDLIFPVLFGRRGK